MTPEEYANKHRQFPDSWEAIRDAYAAGHETGYLDALAHVRVLSSDIVGGVVDTIKKTLETLEESKGRPPE